jgi:Fic family protein
VFFDVKGVHDVQNQAIIYRRFNGGLSAEEIVVYRPVFRMTSPMLTLLGKMEAAREIVESLDLPLDIEREFRQDASTRMTHFSTKIEGNLLTLKQTRELLAGRTVIAREIDKREVMNYYDCLDLIHRHSKSKEPVTEKLIKEIHSTVQKGIVKGKLRGEYREAQNAIYDSRSRKAVYFPPEAREVPSLMKSFLRWINSDRETPPILKAGAAHYQFVTIHPFMDGNGRTARALATFMLYRDGYGLKRFYSLEEYYAEDLMGYYAVLHQCQGARYYDNPNPDITAWLEYFLKGATIVFEQVKERILAAAKKRHSPQSEQDVKLLQKIGPRERRLLAFFRKNLQLRTRNLCSLFDVKERSARDLLAKWMEQGLVEKQGSGKRDAYYVLSAEYRRLIGG